MPMLKSMTEWAGNVKFRLKLFVSYFLLVSFIVIILGFTYYQISASNMLRNVQESIGNVVLNNNQLLDEKLRDIRDKSEVLPIDNELYRAIMDMKSYDNEALIIADRKITNILFKYFGSDDIYSSFIVTPEYTFGNSVRMFVEPDNFFRSKLYRASIESQGDLAWVPTYSYAEAFHEDGMKELSFEFDRLISAVKELNLTFIDDQGIFRTMPQGTKRPVLMVSLTPEFMGRLFTEYAQKSNMTHLSYGILNKDGGSVISSSSVGDSIEDRKPSWFDEAAANKRGSIQQVIDGRKMLISYSQMDSTGWISYIEVPVADALQELKAIRSYSIVFLAVMLVVSALLAYLLSIMITKPIIRLRKAMKMMERGQFQVQVPEHGHDEIGELVRTFNGMNVRIQTLIEENYASRLRQKEAELMALNLQLNPHFLYNTLTTLYWIAVENNQQEMSRIMLSLAEMLQTTTRNKDETWPLRIDLDWLDKYMYIMSSRFQNLFTVTYEVDERLDKMHVPKLFLQPFVENAIIHGLAEMEEGGIIAVKGWIDEDRVIFSVEDNGAGISRERIDGIKSGKVRSTGMANVEKRIKLLYGAHYGIDIYSTEGQGTRIVIQMGTYQESTIAEGGASA
ncbi:histidine kinase [Paenibacillus sp. PR3]|uniref:Histidine kinase n=1 Tax=Paenibacillus terricola TaxID=2763503 RepID=A0ABR8MX42_9BACL|nr:histidine kinase [Paenibacillus terricola]MBD3919626.1 histidine kinase [Paenibacillus terricola]